MVLHISILLNGYITICDCNRNTKNILIQFPITEFFFLIQMNAITRNIFIQIAFFAFKIFSWACATQSELDLSKDRLVVEFLLHSYK